MRSRSLALLGPVILATIALGPTESSATTQSSRELTVSQGVTAIDSQPCRRACRRGFRDGFRDGYRDCRRDHDFRFRSGRGGEYGRGYRMGYRSGFRSC
jgi:hypothetical protein